MNHFAQTGSGALNVAPTTPAGHIEGLAKELFAINSEIVTHLDHARSIADRLLGERPEVDQADSAQPVPNFGGEMADIWKAAQLIQASTDELGRQLRRLSAL